MSVEFDFSALTQKVSELENKMKNKITKEALNAGADEVLEVQKKLVPVDTGATQKALNKSKLKTKKGTKKIDIGLNSDVEKEIILRGYYNNYGARGKGGTYWINESFNQSKDAAVKSMAKVIKEELV